MKKDNLIVDKSFEFALNSIELYKALVAEKEYVLSKQFLRSSTSIGANVEEAIAGESRKDFIHKMAIAAKEARESRYWLRLLDKSSLVNTDVTIQLNGIEEIINILTAIVKTTSGK
ncbi:four helix bundle protein [uncultured Sunxiuqinia sp.]|uniref:four helix bundle protein n=1 Tax=uncultured Sunxiuqinia sp. TaxID=1573825 RepID=UPI0030DD7C0A|tara:strand:+ start:20675 stop:21022 length:348 start_codon:yes stop_codon:yes gene_type:complete